MNHKELTGQTIRESFEKYNRENPIVYSSFKEFAFKAIEMGRDKLSFYLIGEVIRWEHYLKTNDSNFKINNSFIPYFTRLFISQYPEHADKFTLRKLRNEEEAPYMQIDENGQYEFL
jgi:hypothetical protein